MLKAILIIGLVFPCRLPAQVTFERTYGGADDDRGMSVQQTFDGGYIIAGWTVSFGAGQEDVYLIKTDTDGDTLWTRTYGGYAHDVGLSLQQTSDSGYIIVGKTASFGLYSENVYLIKTDADGDTLWTRTYGCADYNNGYSVQQTFDGGYILAGGTSRGAGHVYLIRTDADGDTLWTRTYGGPGAGGYSVQQTSDSGFIVVGYSWSSCTEDYNIYLIKTAANGDTLWTRTYGGYAHDVGHSVQQTSDGGYVITGWTVSFGAGQEDVYLIKTDVNGDTLWTRTYGGTSWDEGRSVQQTSDGGYIIAGYTRSFGSGWTDVYLIKTDAKGVVIGVEEEYYNIAPGKFFLDQNYPNPFNSETQIKFALPEQANVCLEVYDVTGRSIKTLVNKKMDAGYHSVKWDAKDVPSGIYFCKIRVRIGRETKSYTEIKKMIVIR